ncbi:MAG: hypothetical protein M1825_005235 [Sarcosagium campestre]|nr:MAG: hypothetical protein M1825_005235 [Sarcosagium campestre]
MSQPTSSTPVSLVLLPAAPSPTTNETLEAAYSPALTAVLLKQSEVSFRSNSATIVEVAVVAPFLKNPHNSSRGQLFERTQKLLAGVYRLVYLICARNSIEVESRGGVDVRVLLVTGPPTIPLGDFPEKRPAYVSGVVSDLRTLVLHRRPWKLVFSLDSEAGLALSKGFAHLWRALVAPPLPAPEFTSVPGGISLSNVSKEIYSADTPYHPIPSRHLNVAVGGTFDHLHAGHKLLLTMTAFLLEPRHDSVDWDTAERRRLIVGITGDELLKNKQYREYLGSWDERQEAVRSFVDSVMNVAPKQSKDSSIGKSGPKETGGRLELGSDTALECIGISDPFGPTITDESISALVISAETRKGGDLINEKRTDKGWQKLEVFEVDVLSGNDTDDGVATSSVDKDFLDKISSTEIRRRISEKAASNSQNS